MRAHEIVQRPEDLLDRGGEVPLVQPVEVHVIGAEALEARLQGLEDALAVVAAGIGIA